MEELTIIGSGPAGLTAAIYAARANLAPTIYFGAQPGGQLTTTTEVENFPGFAAGIMGPELMEEMQEQAERFGTKLKAESIEKVDLSAEKKIIYTADGKFETAALIIATGANPRWLGIPGERELVGFGVSSCATCDGAFFRDVPVAVVGGGDSACEEADFLTKFASKVYIVHRREELRASKIMQDRVLKNPKIEVLWNTEMREIHGSKKEGVTSAVIYNNQNDSQENRTDLQAVFIAIGHIPNSGMFTEYLDHDDEKYLITKPDSTQTNIPGVYACGDIKDKIFRQAITAAGNGCMAAIEAEHWLAGRK